MPYEARGKCVYKKDTGKKVGCTDGSVKDYLAALYTNTHERLTKEKLVEFIKEEIKSFFVINN